MTDNLPPPRASAGAGSTDPAPPSLTRVLPGWAEACLVGVAGFLLVVGARVLQPTNIRWLVTDDPCQFFLGWAFFRHTPWSFPLGANPNFGLELGNAILYSDAIPLGAFLFKPWASWLPEPFQYQGLWLLACFVLQAYFAWRLARLGSEDQRVRLLAAGLFVFAPPMLFRIPGHFALTSHWTLLAAWDLALSPPRRHQAARWALLTMAAALIQPYLLVMVLIVWSGAWVIGWRRRPSAWPVSVAEAGLVLGSPIVALWQAGLFTVGAGKGGWGYGVYRMNLLALVNPAGWSRVLPNPGWQTGGEYEGLAFPGLGGWLVVIAAILAAVSRHRRGQSLRIRRKWLVFVVPVVFLTALALTNQIGIGPWRVSYPLPERVVALLSITRSSGRMFWPVFYLLLVGATSAVARWTGPRTAVTVLAVALAVQVGDTSAGWLENRARMQQRGRAWDTPLKHPFWQQAGDRYRKIRLVPPGNQQENWLTFADYAERHRMATDATYLSRIDAERFWASIERSEHLLETGGFDGDTIYILQGGTARRVPCLVEPSRDLLAFIDGFWVLAPGGQRQFAALFPRAPDLKCPSLGPGDSERFAQREPAVAWLREGWAWPEAFGTWSRQDRARVGVQLAASLTAVELEMSGPESPGARPVEVLISTDDGPVTTTLVGAAAPVWVRFPLAAPSPAGPRVVTFSFSIREGEPRPEPGDPRPFVRGVMLRQVRGVR